MLHRAPRRTQGEWKQCESDEHGDGEDPRADAVAEEMRGGENQRAHTVHDEGPVEHVTSLLGWITTTRPGRSVSGSFPTQPSRHAADPSRRDHRTVIAYRAAERACTCGDVRLQR